MLKTQRASANAVGARIGSTRGIDDSVKVEQKNNKTLLINESFSESIGSDSDADYVAVSLDHTS